LALSKSNRIPDEARPKANRYDSTHFDFHGKATGEIGRTFEIDQLAILA
jgi:hypothetical protein